jgi:hypothetical protein
MPENMTHNGFDFLRDLILPMLNFLDANCKEPITYSMSGTVSLPDIYFIDHDFERLKRRERMKKQSIKNQGGKHESESVMSSNSKSASKFLNSPIKNKKAYSRKLTSALHHTLENKQASIDFVDLDETEDKSWLGTLTDCDPKHKLKQNIFGKKLNSPVKKSRRTRGINS